uniref:peptidylprolyl isomerase n=1 Tax=Parastrongyloides trichosuri TaxID=131310 RepID=A0A0N4Z1V6_PARTI
MNDYSFIESNKYEDILGSGGILKKTLKKGDGGKKPIDGDKVKIKYSFLKNSQTTTNEFVLGYLQEVEGIEIACKCMEKGEVCEVICKPHLSYGDIGLPGMLEPNEEMEIKIELIDFDDNYLLSSQNDVVTHSIQFRVKGKFYFVRNEVDRAIFVYTKILSMLDEWEQDSEVKNEASIVACNLSLCYYTISEYKKALQYANLAISLNKFNDKAYYRYIIILEILKEYDKAIDAIDDAIKLFPTKHFIFKRILHQCIDNKKKVDDDEKNIFKKMLKRQL